MIDTAHPAVVLPYPAFTAYHTHTPSVQRAGPSSAGMLFQVLALVTSDLGIPGANRELFTSCPTLQFNAFGSPDSQPNPKPRPLWQSQGLPTLLPE